MPPAAAPTPAPMSAPLPAPYPVPAPTAAPVPAPTAAPVAVPHAVAARARSDSPTIGVMNRVFIARSPRECWFSSGEGVQCTCLALLPIASWALFPGPGTFAQAVRTTVARGTPRKCPPSWTSQRGVGVALAGGRGQYALRVWDSSAWEDGCDESSALTTTSICCSSCTTCSEAGASTAPGAPREAPLPPSAPDHRRHHPGGSRLGDC